MFNEGGIFCQESNQKKVAASFTLALISKPRQAVVWLEWSG
jgi:hypothetical protein